jgi:hypothetical protein
MISPNGVLLATTDDNGAVRLWHPQRIVPMPFREVLICPKRARLAYGQYRRAGLLPLSSKLTEKTPVIGPHPFFG